jgi:hypothetical protein
LLLPRLLLPRLLLPLLLLLLLLQLSLLRDLPVIRRGTLARLAGGGIARARLPAWRTHGEPA